MANKKLTLDETMEVLDAIILKLESQTLSEEEAKILYEKATDLINRSQQKLDDIEADLYEQRDGILSLLNTKV